MSGHDHHDDGSGVSRRHVLECMTWAGTGVLWTVARRRAALARPHRRGAARPRQGLTFLQISDSHIGFDKPANPDVKRTLAARPSPKIKAIPTSRPS